MHSIGGSRTTKLHDGIREDTKECGEAQIQPKEELEEANLGPDPGTPKLFFISSQLTAKENERLVELLKKYVDVFAWTYDEMPVLDPRLVVHSLNVGPETKLVI